MATEVKVPVLPESVSDATIATWNKQVGDAVARDENLVDLETDKVVLEVPSPVDGVLKEIRHEVGDTVNSQQVIAVLEEGAAAPAPSTRRARSVVTRVSQASAISAPAMTGRWTGKRPQRSVAIGTRREDRMAMLLKKHDITYDAVPGLPPGRKQALGWPARALATQRG